MDINKHQNLLLHIAQLQTIRLPRNAFEITDEIHEKLYLFLIKEVCY